jgi:hypothetical protein
VCWGVGKNTHFRFVSANDEIHFELYFGIVPESYQVFPDRIKHKCIKNKSGQLVFSYKLTGNGEEEINKFIDFQQKMKRRKPLILLQAEGFLRTGNRLR